MESNGPQGLIWAGIVAIVFLLLGGMIVGILFVMIPTGSFKDYVYTPEGNSTGLNINVSAEKTHYINLGTIPTLTSETRSDYIKVETRSANASNTSIRVSLNGVYVGNVTATAASWVNSTITGVTFVNGVNNITYNSSYTLGSTVNVSQSIFYRPSSTTNTEGGAGGMYDGLASGYGAVVAVALAVISLFLIFALLRMTGMLNSGGAKGA
jgi:hypothetical protein